MYDDWLKSCFYHLEELGNSSFQKLLAERYLLRTSNQTICSSENVRDYFSLVANLLGDVLVKKSVAVWQRRTEILRPVSLSRTHILPKIIGGLSLGALKVAVANLYDAGSVYF